MVVAAWWRCGPRRISRAGTVPGASAQSAGHFTDAHEGLPHGHVIELQIPDRPTDLLRIAGQYCGEDELFFALDVPGQSGLHCP